VKRRNMSSVLIEMIIVILFFSLSAAIIVQVLGKADAVSKESRLKNEALLVMESLAEEREENPAAFPSRETCEYKGFRVEVTVEKTARPLGDYYDILLSSYAGEKELLAFSTARYVAREAGR